MLLFLWIALVRRLALGLLLPFSIRRLPLLGDVIIWSVAFLFIDYILLNFIIRVSESLVWYCQLYLSVSNLFTPWPAKPYCIVFYCSLYGVYVTYPGEQ